MKTTDEKCTMSREELIKKLNNAPGKHFIEDGYFYSYALIQKAGEKTETVGIIRYPKIQNQKGKTEEMEILYYTPEIKV